MEPARAVIVRPAREADAELLHRAVLRMAEGLGAAGTVASTPESFRRHGFGARAAFEALIAEEEGRFAGMCLFFPSFSSWRGEPGVYVLDLYVEASFRGKGVGQALLGAVAALARERGGAYVRLSVDAGNARAQGFYETLGFTWKSEERIFSLDSRGLDALAAGRRR